MGPAGGKGGEGGVGLIASGRRSFSSRMSFIVTRDGTLQAGTDALSRHHSLASTTLILTEPATAPVAKKRTIRETRTW